MRLDRAQRSDGRFIRTHVEKGKRHQSLGMIDEVLGRGLFHIATNQLVVTPDMAKRIVALVNLQ